MSHGRRAAAVIAAACLSSLGTLAAAASARAATGPDVPAVDIVPIGTTTHDPNHGTWFVARQSPGTTTDGKAMLLNPANVAQTVTLLARELDFNASGTPTVSNSPTAGIASWVAFAQPSVTVPARQRLIVDYTVHAPSDAEPGDHTGVLVAQSAPVAISANLQLVKRVATRFYVTVPGKAIVGYNLRSLQVHLNNPLFPGQEHAQVTVINTGNIRFVPGVLINGKPAVGSNLVLSQSIEIYRSDVHVPWYGGPVHIRVAATADGAEPETLSKTVWVIPWGLLAILLVVIAGVVHFWVFGRHKWRAYKTEQASLRAQVAELQQIKADSSRP